MNTLTLKHLLEEYANQRSSALEKAKEKKEKLYSDNPRLQEIDDLLSQNSILLAKLLLSSGNTSTVQKLEHKNIQLREEKDKILKKLHIDRNYFLPHFQCELCKDTGYITEGYQTKMCRCLEQKIFDIEYNKLNVYNMQNQTFDKFNLQYYSDIIDKTKYHSKISPRENMKQIKDICEKFIEQFDDPEGKNLLFFGNSGLGKTFLSNCIANELLKKKKTVLYQTAPVMLDTIINYRLDRNSNFSSDIYENLLNVDLLVIDDLGTENMNNMKFAELFTVINSRLLPKKDKITKTIISTNLDLHELAAVYGERIVSRFAGNYLICPFFGEDIRLIKK